MDKDLIEKAKAARARANKLRETKTRLHEIILTGYVHTVTTGSALTISGTENWDELDWLMDDLISYTNSYCHVLEEDIKKLEKKVQALPKNDADQEQDKE